MANSRRIDLIETATALAALLAALISFHFLDIDLPIQDFFYSHPSGAWIVPKNSALPRLLFYTGPKILLICLGIWFAVSAAVQRFTRRRHRFLSNLPPARLLYAIVCLGLFPASIAALKKVSGLHCPSELKRYGGKHEYRPILSARPSDPRELGHCFPAGHASGGFALLGLSRLARTRRAKIAAIASALAAGWLMGLYQMLNGSHFLSHTVTTMLLAWLFTAGLSMLLPPNTPSEGTAKNGARVKEQMCS